MNQPAQFDGLNCQFLKLKNQQNYLITKDPGQVVLSEYFPGQIFGKKSVITRKVT